MFSKHTNLDISGIQLTNLTRPSLRYFVSTNSVILQKESEHGGLGHIQLLEILVCRSVGSTPRSQATTKLSEKLKLRTQDPLDF